MANTFSYGPTPCHVTLPPVTSPCPLPRYRPSARVTPSSDLVTSHGLIWSRPMTTSRPKEGEPLVTSRLI
eukprot:834044-Rhodomonas_salina.2